MSNNKVVSFNDEKLICVDEQDNIVGYKTKSEMHQGDGILHRAFSIFIYLDSGEVLLQKRSQKKQLWPNYWSNSCCSHPRKGESYLKAAHRRMLDELGIDTELKYQFTFKYIAQYRDIGTEKELCTVLTGVIDDPERINININEIEKLDWFSPNEIDEMIFNNPNQFTPWFLLEWASLNNRDSTIIYPNELAI